jgi:uncharacterized tellurite resistance protein B-like protein
MMREAHEALARDGWDARLAVLSRSLAHDPVRAEAALLLGAAVAYADGVITDEENNVMSLLMTALDVDPARLDVLIALLENVDSKRVDDRNADAAALLLHAAMRLHAPEDLESFAATSTKRPELALILRLFASFVRSCEELLENSTLTPTSISAARIAALRSLAEALPDNPSPRLDDLWQALGRLSGALDFVDRTAVLRAMVDPTQSPPPIVTLELALARVAQMVTRAERHLGGDVELTPIPGDLRPAVEAVVDGRPGAREVLERTIGLTVEWSRHALPGPLSATLDHALRRLPSLPVERASAQPPAKTDEAPLPEWVPSRRTIGGFHLIRPLGSGSTACVFEVCRAEDRDEPNPQRFALKVPQFDAVAAQSVSEAEFFALFREEAGALLALPDHPNLAGFVTFDARARPKPILVMELVEGVDCETLLSQRRMDVPRALSILDGVLSGLIEMHARRIGHLDIKPSNVVLRGGVEPVLVDFGLSGRRIRPWCATPPYAAPEVWGHTVSGRATPMSADVYAFGCLAWEMLTGRQLFDGANATALMQTHLGHDGGPDSLRKMVKDPARRDLATAISACLRRDPDARPVAETLRLEFKRIAGTTTARWPIG